MRPPHSFHAAADPHGPIDYSRVTLCTISSPSHRGCALAVLLSRRARVVGSEALTQISEFFDGATGLNSLFYSQAANIHKEAFGTRRDCTV